MLASTHALWWDTFERALFLRDANTMWVVLGVLALGIASGAVGAFLVLRRRALTADAISHATLPGIAVAFIVMVGAGLTGKSLPGLLLGAYIAGLVAMVVIVLIRRTTRLKDDAAIGIVLSVFFGLGICLLSFVQQMPSGNAAGLESFIFGKAANHAFWGCATHRHRIIGGHCRHCALLQGVWRVVLRRSMGGGAGLASDGIGFPADRTGGIGHSAGHSVRWVGAGDRAAHHSRFGRRCCGPSGCGSSS